MVVLPAHKFRFFNRIFLSAIQFFRVGDIVAVNAYSAKERNTKNKDKDSGSSQQPSGVVSHLSHAYLATDNNTSEGHQSYRA
jgi:hypothetical protein